METVNLIEIRDKSNNKLNDYYFSDKKDIDCEFLIKSGYEFRMEEGINGMRVMVFQDGIGKETHDLMYLIKTIYIAADLNIGKSIKFN